MRRRAAGAVKMRNSAAAWDVESRFYCRSLSAILVPGFKSNLQGALSSANLRTCGFVGVQVTKLDLFHGLETIARRL
jgi:hypothetical protein